DLLAQLLDELPAALVRELAMDDQRERVDRINADENVDTHERGREEGDVVVVEACITACTRLECVVEVEDNLGERQLVGEVHAVLRQVLHVVEAATSLVAELHHAADVFLRDDDRGLDVRLFDLVEGVRHLGGVVQLHRIRLVLRAYLVGDVGRGDEQVEVELTLEPFAHDLHVQQAEE